MPSEELQWLDQYPERQVLFANTKYPPVFRTCKICKKLTWCYATSLKCPNCNRQHQRQRSEQNRKKPRKRHRPNPRTVVPTNMDIAWAAGFLEGEAGIGHRHGSAVIQVAQVEWDPIIRLVQLFGGSVHTLPARKATHTPALYWLVAGARARGLLLTVYQFMSPRRQEQIRKAL